MMKNITKKETIEIKDLVETLEKEVNIEKQDELCDQLIKLIYG